MLARNLWATFYIWLATGLAFVAVKIAAITEVAHWPWWLVLIPWWGPVALIIAVFLATIAFGTWLTKSSLQSKNVGPWGPRDGK